MRFFWFSIKKILTTNNAIEFVHPFSCRKFCSIILSFFTLSLGENKFVSSRKLLTFSIKLNKSNTKILTQQLRSMSSFISTQLFVLNFDGWFSVFFIKNLSFYDIILFYLKSNHQN